MSKEVATRANTPTYLIEFVESGKPNDYTDLIVSKSPKFLPFISQHGKMALKGLIGLVFTEISNLLRFETNSAMIDAAADVIIQDFPDTKLDDLKMFKDDMIRGKVGGKLFGWDARTIVECWQDYYAKREDVFAAAREAKFAEEKRQYQESYIASSDKIKDLYAGLRQSASQQRLEQSYREKVRTMTLEEICTEAKLDYSAVMENIKEQARTDWADSGMELTFELYLDVLTHKILLEARKNVDALGRYV